MLVNLTDQDNGQIAINNSCGNSSTGKSRTCDSNLVWYHRLTILAHISMEVGLDIE